MTKARCPACTESFRRNRTRYTTTYALGVKVVSCHNKSLQLLSHKIDASALVIVIIHVYCYMCGLLSSPVGCSYSYTTCEKVPDHQRIGDADGIPDDAGDGDSS